MTRPRTLGGRVSSSFKRGFGGEPVRHPPVATVVLRPGVERLRAVAQWARRHATRFRGLRAG